MIVRPESASLEPLLEQLGLRQAAAVLPDWLDRAASQELSYADFLHGLLEEERVARANAALPPRNGYIRLAFRMRPPSSSSTSASVPSSSARSCCATWIPPSSSKLGRWH